MRNVKMKRQMSKVLLVVLLCVSAFAWAHVESHDHFVARAYSYNLDGTMFQVRRDEHGSMTVVHEGRPVGTTHEFCRVMAEATH